MYRLSTLKDNTNYKSFLLSILDSLEKIPRGWAEELCTDRELCTDEEKICVGGTGDTCQTDFEQKSNQGKIGVVASSKKQGFALVFLLQMIIDDNYPLIGGILEGWEIEDEAEEDEELDREFSMEQILNIISADPEGCWSVHPMNKKSYIPLHYGYSSTVQSQKMDLWTLDRIRKHIENQEDFNLS